MKRNNIKPKTGRKTDSKVSSILEKLSTKDPEGPMPELPEPIFDADIPKMWKKRKK